MCDSEIGELCVPIWPDKDIFWLYVSVDDAVFVNMGQGGSDLAQDHRPDFPWKRFSLLVIEELTQRCSLNKFHDDENIVTLFVRIIIGFQNGGMFKTGDSLGFSPKPFAGFEVRYQVRVEEFQGHFAIQSRIQGAIDDRHTTLAYFFDYFVATYASSDIRIALHEFDSTL
jgi:hypothetical protein